MQRSGDVSLSPPELLALAQQQKARGNDLYRKKDYEAASASYHEALADLAEYVGSPCTLDGEDDPTRPALSVSGGGPCDDSGRELHLTCVVNDALCELQRSQFGSAARKASHALQFDPSRVKALYVRARATAQLGRFAEAHVDLDTALAVEPDNKSVLKELEDLIELESQATLRAKRAGGNPGVGVRAGGAGPSASLAAWISNGGIETFEGAPHRGYLCSARPITAADLSMFTLRPTLSRHRQAANRTF